MDIKKNLFTERAVKHQRRLPREPVESLSLDVFKRSGNVALSNVV